MKEVKMIESRSGGAMEIESAESSSEKISQAEEALFTEGREWASSKTVSDLRPGGQYSKKATALATMLFLFGLTTEAVVEQRRLRGDVATGVEMDVGKRDKESAVIEEKRLSPETKQALTKILAYDSENKGLILRLASPESDFYRGDKEISFDKDHLASAETPIQVKQDLLKHLQFFLAYPEKEWSARGISGPIRATTKDKYGNLIRRNGNFVTDENGQKMYAEMIRIYPGFLGSLSENSQTEMWSFDLSSFGHPEVKNLIEREALPSQRKVGSYQLYTQSPELSFSPEQMLRLESLGEGQAMAEKFFGFTPGEIVKNILVLNEKASHGPSASKNERDLVYYSSPFLQGEGYGDQIYGAHEAIHNIVNSLNLIGPKIAKEFEIASLRPDLTNVINEGNSYRGLITEKAGHAGDNEDEFITSVINSLLVSNWESWVDTKVTNEWRGWYAGVLRSLQSDLQRQPKISKDAPINKSLAKKIGYLEGRVLLP